MRRRRTVLFVDFQLFAALFVIAYVFSICLILSVKVCEDIQLAGAVPLKPNSFTLSGSKLVADRFEAGRRPASNQLAYWNLAFTC